MVQQNSYAQEVKKLMEKQEVATNNFLKTLQPFIDQEGLLTGGGRLQQYVTSLSNYISDDLPINHHFTRFVMLAEHTRHHHVQPQLPTASLRERYLIPRIKELD